MNHALLDHALRRPAGARRGACRRPLDQARDRPQPVFRSGADLVRFDVRVTDASGRPIKDLRPEEIEIVEDGAARPILLFQHIDEPSGSYARSGAALGVGGGLEQPRRAHAATSTSWSSIRRTSRPATSRSRGARRRRSSRRASARPIASPSSASPGPGRRWDSPPIARAPMAELAKVHAARCERNVKSAGGKSLGARSVRDRRRERQRHRRRPDAPVRRPHGRRRRRGRGRRWRRGRSRRARETAGGSRRHPAVIRENARNVVVAQADADGARFAAAAGRSSSRSTAPSKDARRSCFFSEGFHQQQRHARAGAGRGGGGRELRRLLLLRSEPAAEHDIAAGVRRRRRREASEIQARTEPLGSLAAETDGALITDAASHIDAALDRIADQAQDYYLVGFTPSAAALCDARTSTGASRCA